MVSIFSPDWRNEILRQMSTYLTQADGDARYGQYESGTWAPSLSFGGSSTGITYSLATGIYRKIGQAVLLEGTIQLSSKGSATGTATITGVPFTSFSVTGIGGVGNFRHATNMNLAGVPYPQIGSSSVSIVLNYWPAAGGQQLNLDNTHFNNNSILNFALSYIAA